MSYPSAPPPSGGVNPYGNQHGQGEQSEVPAVPSSQPDVPQPPVPPSGGQPWQTPAMPAYGTPPPSTYDVPPPPPTPPGYGSPSQQYGQPTYGGPAGSYSPYLATGQVPGAPGWYASSRDNGKGTGALIMGILSIVFCAGSLLGIGLGIGAVIMGSQGRRAVAGGTADNGGVATTGYVLGIIGIVLSVIASLGYLTNAVQ